MDISQVKFGDPPALRWESVIREGDKQRSLDKLAPVLLKRYANNPQLQLAVSPWIRGNPPEPIVEEPLLSGATMLAEPVAPTKPAAPTSVVTETPTTITTTTQVPKVKIPGTSVEIELVPVTVPKEFVEEAQIALVATISSLRLTVAQHEQWIKEIMDWRQAISAMSRAEVANRTGANEPGVNRDDTLAMNAMPPSP